MLRRARALARALYPVPCPRRRCHQPCPPRDLAVPNAGWSERMRRHYGHQRDRARAQGWTRLPSYRQYRPQVLGLAGDTGATGDRDTRLFPRAIEGDGDGFEFAMFLSVPGGRLRCLCQLGPFLEAPPGPVPLLSVLLLEALLQSRQGRKLFLSCDLRDAEGTTLHARATGLFIQQDAPKEPPRGGDSGQ
ncbi:acyl-coenzyme A thioesterase THEM4-like isoform X4 [Onychostruthus taczanowskii]|uniref:acyl-coenzyme A thioesterase THEM4-like isoform X4 n=1 Tax=Onychostruthus taczanowskii TaxID=356909 RepID=UPI001B801C2F|nr:acyl-coenzyme A thioesterase THEM4-like isoform X4 [Onychostruthus taczanowskii]